jgi:hypothetical protein
MDTITVYPNDVKQMNLLKSLLIELKVRFKMATSNQDTLLSKEDFYSKIDKSIKQAELGKTKRIPINRQKELLGL